MGSPGARRLAALLLTLGLWGCQGAPSQEQAARFDAYMALAEGYADAGDFDRARRPLASALDVNDRAWRPHLILARIYDAEGEPDLAEAAFRRARRYGGEQAEVHNDYGVFLYGQGRFAEAVGALRRAAEDADFPARAVAFENLGQALDAAEAPEAARDAFQRALALAPCAQRPLLALTRWYLTEGDVPRARSLAERFARCAPDNEESLTLALAIARRLGDPDAEAEASRRLEALGTSAP
jgi:type IV pilus assembly protein PilF